MLSPSQWGGRRARRWRRPGWYSRWPGPPGPARPGCWWKSGKCSVRAFYFKKVFLLLLFFIIAMVNKFPRMLSSGGRRLRETWGGPIRNRLCILGGPIRNRLCILGRPIWNHLCNLGWPIRKHIRKQMYIWVKESRKTGFSSGWEGCIFGGPVRNRLSI